MHFYSLAKMRNKVWYNRTHSDLFNVEAYAHDMEEVYAKMWKRYENGLEADHITDAKQ